MHVKEFRDCKEELIRRGEIFANRSLISRTEIAELGHSFVQFMVILELLLHYY
jgi:hypothetical protein